MIFYVNNSNHNKIAQYTLDDFRAMVYFSDLLTYRG